MSFWAKLCFKHALIRAEGLSQVSEVKPLPGESSSSLSVEGEVPQDAIWDIVTEEKEQWQALISSREYREVERHFALCDSKISSVVAKITSLYKASKHHGGRRYTARV